MATLAQTDTTGYSSSNCLLAWIDEELSDGAGALPMRHASREPGRTVFEQGDPTQSWFWLCEGQVRLTRRTLSGRRQILCDVYPGQAFGMEALTQERVYDKSAVAVDESSLISISTHDLPPELLRHPRLMAEISKSLVRQTIELQERLKDVLTRGTRERVVAALIYLVKEGRSALDSPDSAYAITATNDELAAMAGTTPQTVSNCLSRLQRRGLVERRRGVIKLFNLDTLVDLNNLS